MAKTGEIEQEKITPQILLRAYTLGLFPMAESAHDPTLFWIEPDYRGIIPLEAFKASRRLARQVRQQRYDIRTDTQFEQVIDKCAQITPTRQETWINQTLRELYIELFNMGYCHSVECWHEGKLVGGLYGVHIGGAFFGESMFSTMPNASKIALVYLVERLKLGKFSLLDTQFVTDHLRQFGAIEVLRSDYMKKLKHALSIQGRFYAAELK